jgi:hypothetical protein
LLAAPSALGGARLGGPVVVAAWNLATLAPVEIESPRASASGRALYVHHRRAAVDQPLAADLVGCLAAFAYVGLGDPAPQGTHSFAGARLEPKFTHLNA